MQPPKILIIDDDPDITEAMKITLESRDYEVNSAVNGTEGMEQIKNNRPDLIILDVMMDTPREGFQLDRELKSDPQLKDIPVMMVTAVKEKTGIDFKPEAGDPSWLPVDEFLDKPIKPDQLLEKVKALLDKTKK